MYWMYCGMERVSGQWEEEERERERERLRERVRQPLFITNAKE